MITIAEDLVVLLHDPETGRPTVDSVSLDRAVGGALLLDLSLVERVTADSDGARAKLSVIEGKPIGDALLDDALGRLTGDPVRAQRAVERLSKKTRGAVLDRLVERGVLRKEESRRLGIFPSTAYPVADKEPGAALRAQLKRVLLEGADPDQRLACLVSLLHAVKAEHRVVDGPRRELRKRAAEVAEGEWAGAAVRKAVQSVQMSVAAAVSVSVAAGAASSG